MNNMRNKVQLIGKIENMPDLKESKTGNTVLSFVISTKEKFINSKGEKIDNTDYHKVVAYGNNAINLKNMMFKGDKIAINGKLKNRNWIDENEKEIIFTEVVINEFIAIEKNKKQEAD